MVAQSDFLKWTQELIFSKLEELGFTLEDAGDLGFIFRYEELNVLYMPDDDENFLRFAVPGIYDVTEENKALVFEVVNNTNMSIKYSKTFVYGDDVWIFYECRLYSEDYLEQIIEHGMLLKATYYLFYRKIEGDDTLPCNNDDDNDNETEEDE